MRQSHSIAILAFAGALALAGCSKSPDQATADSTGAEQTATDAAGHQADSSDSVETNGMTFSNARIQLPAVAGRPGVAYFDLSRADEEGDHDHRDAGEQP